MKSENKKLFRRYIDNLYSTDDARSFLDMVRHQENKGIVEHLADEAWEESAMQDVTTGIDFERYKDEGRSLLRRINTGRNVLLRRVAITAASIAAAFLLIFGGIDMWNYWNDSRVIFREMVTSYGETKNLILADGTLVVLNSCSKVRYPDRFTANERRIELNGEGYFQVQRNEEKPFVVKTSRFDVKVLGTSFNIKSYQADELVSVNVESGKVQVDMPEAMMRLRANEQVLINTVTGNYEKVKTREEVAQWRNGTLCFYETPIRDVAKELERIYHCTITFASGQVFNNLITGEHDNVSLDAVLRSIEYTSGIHYRQEGNHIYMYK